MQKKLLVLFVFMSALILLSGCKPSDTYVGDWYAVSNDGEKAKIVFSKEKTLTIDAENGKTEKYDINQNAMGFKNNVGYYQIDIDHKSYYILLENRKDKSNALLVRQTNVASDFEDMVGEVVYTMNRDDYPDKPR